MAAPTTAAARAARSRSRPPRRSPRWRRASCGRSCPSSLPGLGHVNCYFLEDERGVAIVDPGLPGPAVVAGARRPAEAGRLQAARTSTRWSSRTRTPTTSAARGGSATPTAPRSSRTAASAPGSTRSEDEAARRPTRRRDSAPAPPPVRAGRCRGAPTRRSGRRSAGGCKYGLYRARRSSGFMRTPTPTRRVDDAEVVTLAGREWVALHTPGHTDDHLCLFDPAEGIVLSGDHVLPTITPAHLRPGRRRRPAHRVLRLARQGGRPRGRHASRSPPTATRSTTSRGRAHEIRDHHERAPRHPADGRRPSSATRRSRSYMQQALQAAVVGPDGRERDLRPPRAPPRDRRGHEPRRPRHAALRASSSSSRELGRAAHAARPRPTSRRRRRPSTHSDSAAVVVGHRDLDGRAALDGRAGAATSARSGAREVAPRPPAPPRRSASTRRCSRGRGRRSR